ncbi:probable ATP-dependent RNA helicase DDX20 [Epargyreus clarus]|uniref:probable ATP-dependent RNA helicase DDX20 n=1 Tax=Epargyreus clarus TaxID=520877 RepID=UPI003C2E036E
MVLAHDITKGERTRDVKITQNITFETMLLAPKTLQGLTNAGFYKPSPIQLYGIPIGKCGFDLLLEAKSGTGKTAVFSIIALEKLDFCKGLQVVILTPTREIAAQVCDVLKEIGSPYEDLNIEVVMGGLPYQEDIGKFKKTVHIVVGSPGRLKHLIQNKHIDTSAVRLLVLDEADKLMEKNFQTDIQFIHSALPKQKQVIMSSATYSDSSKSLINNYVHNANHVCPDSDSILLGIEQKVTFVKYNDNIVRHTKDRFKELLNILVQIPFKQCLVFCNYQVRVSEVHKLLKKEKWPSQQLYGQQEQVDRLDALKTLQQYKCRILVSTDLAARGIDASNIDLVINFEPPYEWQTYLHRIGRAGRYGSYGLAVTILSEGREQLKFKDMFKSMELRINMHNLWTGEDFIQDNSNIPPEPSNTPAENPACSNFSEEVNREAMWAMLNNKSENVGIESFENLCITQKETETSKIEAFSDLISSLDKEYSQANEEMCEFKRIEMRKVSPIKLVSASKDLKNPVLNKHKHVFINDINENIEVNRVNKVEGSDLASNSIDNENEEYKKVFPDSLSKANDNINSIDTTKGKSETQSLENEMIALELPIMFSSTKLKRHESKVNQDNNTSSTNKTMSKSRYNVNNENGSFSMKCRLQSKSSMPTKKQDLHDFNDSESIPKTYKKCKINKRNVTETDDCEIKNSNADRHNRSKYTVQYTHSSSEIDDEHVSHLQNHISENNAKQKKSVKLYTNWYNQLKMRMNFVQQAIYIDEMSRL